MPLLCFRVAWHMRWSPLVSRVDAEQIGQSDRLVAMGTGPARPDPAAELPTVGAALFAEEPRAAGRALVHRRRARRATGQRRYRRGVAAPPGGLAAGCGAEALAPGRGEGATAAGAGYRYAIVTARAIKHRGPPSSAAALPRR